MKQIVRLSEKEQQELLAYCRARDVNNGGIFNVRSAAINVWSRPWLSEEDCRQSECIATIWLKSDRVELEGAVPTGLLGIPLPLRARREKVTV